MAGIAKLGRRVLAQAAANDRRDRRARQRRRAQHLRREHQTVQQFRLRLASLLRRVAKIATGTPSRRITR